MSQPLPIAGLNHLGRLTTCLEESKAFYRDVLGFREVQRPNFDFPGAWLYNYGLMIHLIVDESAPQPQGELRRRVEHTAFHTDDIEAVQRQLDQRGIPYRVGQVADTGVKQLFFRDPSGYYIEVASYPPTPPFLGPA